MKDKISNYSLTGDAKDAWGHFRQGPKHMNERFKNYPLWYKFASGVAITTLAVTACRPKSSATPVAAGDLFCEGGSLVSQPAMTPEYIERPEIFAEYFIAPSPIGEITKIRVAEAPADIKDDILANAESQGIKDGQIIYYELENENGVCAPFAIVRGPVGSDGKAAHFLAFGVDRAGVLTAPFADSQSFEFLPLDQVEESDPKSPNRFVNIGPISLASPGSIYPVFIKDKQTDQWIFISPFPVVDDNDQIIEPKPTPVQGDVFNIGFKSAPVENHPADWININGRWISPEVVAIQDIVAQTNDYTLVPDPNDKSVWCIEFSDPSTKEVGCVDGVRVYPDGRIGIISGGHPAFEIPAAEAARSFVVGNDGKLRVQNADKKYRFDDEKFVSESSLPENLGEDERYAQEILKQNYPWKYSPDKTQLLVDWDKTGNFEVAFEKVGENWELEKFYAHAPEGWDEVTVEDIIGKGPNGNAFLYRSQYKDWYLRAKTTGRVRIEQRRNLITGEDLPGYMIIVEAVSRQEPGTPKFTFEYVAHADDGDGIDMMQGLGGRMKTVFDYAALYTPGNKIGVSFLIAKDNTSWKAYPWLEPTITTNLLFVDNPYLTKYLLIPHGFSSW